MKELKQYEVCKSNNGEQYQAYFYNKIESNQEYIGNYKTEEEANKAYSEYQLNFYSDKKYLIPNNISVDMTRKCFAYSIKVKGVKILHKRFPTIQSCINFRNELLQTIIKL